VHPSRHGTYDGISMHPFEVVFLKASWHVGEPFADKYSAWQTTYLRGQSTTKGVFDQAMYRYAIQCALQAGTACAALLTTAVRLLHVAHGSDAFQLPSCSKFS
jgi:hypothetical protein